MIGKAVFPVDPWQVREASLDLDLLAQTESVFALANGHIGLRGNLDEGEPHVIAGTYLNSYYEQRPLPYPEGGYGYPEQGQTVVNVTDGKLIRLMVDDEPFHVAHGRLLAHERVLDLRTGVLRRTRRLGVAGRAPGADPQLPAGVLHPAGGRRHRLRGRGGGPRAADHRSSRAWWPTRSNRSCPRDPRVAAALDRPLVAVAQDTEQHGAVLLHRTRASGLLMARRHGPRRQAPGGYDEETDVRDDWARTTVVTVLRPGERLRITKFLGYAWSSTRSPQALRDQVAGALTGAQYAGWDGLVGRPARLSRRLLGRRRRRDRRRPGAAAGGPLRPVPRAAGRRPRRAAGDRGQGPDRAGVRRARVLGHRGLRPAAADLHRPARRGGRAAVAAQHPRPGAAPGPARSASPARRSRGAPSTARSVRRTGRPAPRRCT